MKFTIEFTTWNKPSNHVKKEFDTFEQAFNWLELNVLYFTTDMIKRPKKIYGRRN